MEVTVLERKQSLMHRLAGKLLCQATQGQFFILASGLKTFCGTAVPSYLAVPLSTFYTRGLYDSLSYARRKMEDDTSRVRLGIAELRELRYWRKFGPEGRKMQPSTPFLCVHSDGADIGWGAL